MSKVKIKFEVVLKTEDEDEVIGIKEAMANLVEPWQDIEKPIKIEIIDPQKEQSEIEAMFEDFWKEYPRKVNKVNSFKAFKKVCKDRKTLDSLLVALAEHKKTEQWKIASLVPHASTWLNGHRWEDDLSTLADKPEGQKASYNLDKFEQKSLTDEIVYKKRREKKADVS